MGVSNIKVIDSNDRELGRLVSSNQVSMTIMTSKGYIYSIKYDGKPHNFDYPIYSSQRSCDGIDYFSFGSTYNKIAIDANELYAGTLLLVDTTSSHSDYYIGKHFTVCSAGVPDEGMVKYDVQMDVRLRYS